MTIHNITQIGVSDIQLDGTSGAPEIRTTHTTSRKETEGTIDCHLVFVSRSTLKKSAPVLGKLCRWRLLRHVALKILNLTFKVCNSGFVCFHVLHPYVKYGKSRWEMDPVGFVWPNVISAYTATSESQRCNGNAEAEVLTCNSVGWLVSKTKRAIILASHVTDENEPQRCGQMTIPRKSIITVNYL